ncbi:MAG: endonuclease/exonuclease/phosphatase family protein [Planctomycetes bacterium]|nr:endonuclease/exonuclease/phosphatase family protein [Planctomycetota bacterium]
MRRRLAKLGIPALLIAGVFYFLQQHYQIDGLSSLRSLTLKPRVSGDASVEIGLPSGATGDAIRIASFNIQVFGESKLEKPAIVELLAEIVRSFDVVAIQEVRAQSQDLLPRFLDAVNAKGAHYHYVLGPRLGRTSSKEQYAFIYNMATVELDRESVYTVHDPDDLLHREPLVAGFRVRGPPVEEAFTFTLINIHTDPDEVAVEIEALDDVFRAVRDDGRYEDDLILLGDFNADDVRLRAAGGLGSVTAAISGQPTNTRGTDTYDNLLFQPLTTSEFTGRAGVVDLLRAFNLTMERALEISDHCPVWAEFSIREGGRGGRVAARDAAPAR